MLRHILTKDPPATVWVLALSGIKATLYRLENRLVERPSSWTRRHPLTTSDKHMKLIPIPEVLSHSDDFRRYERHTVGHTTTPHPDLYTEMEDTLAKNIAVQIEKACQKGLFDCIIIVAPVRLMARFRQHLIPSVQALVALEIPKNPAGNGNTDEKSILLHIEEAINAA